MSPELGPPETDVREFGTEDVSWAREWEALRSALEGGAPLDDLPGARLCWALVEDAYARNGYPLA